jgi:hypothetical protein
VVHHNHRHTHTHTQSGGVAESPAQVCLHLGSCMVDIELAPIWRALSSCFAPPPPRPPRAPHSLCIIVMSRASCAFSNRSDEDDLPPDLAEAVGATTATTTTTTTTTMSATQVSVSLASPKIQKVSSPQKSEVKSPLSPGAKVWERGPGVIHVLNEHLHFTYSVACMH